MKILETKRCILRPVTLEDSADLFECYKQDIVVKYLPIKKHKSIKDTEDFIKSFFLKNYNYNKISHFVIVYKKDNKVIGNVGFNNISINSKSGEIGICINPTYWGNNLSTELAIELLRYGFEELSLEKIIAIAFEENRYSKKPLEFLGFTFTGAYRKKMHTKQNIICHKYEMARADYLSKNYKIYNAKG